MLGMGLVYDSEMSDDMNLAVNAIMSVASLHWQIRKANVHLAFYKKHLYKRPHFKYKKK